MSYWTTVINNDLKDIGVMNYPKLNVLQQKIADMFQGEDLSQLDVWAILCGMKEKEMVNKEFLLRKYREEHKDLIAAEARN